MKPRHSPLFNASLARLCAVGAAVAVSVMAGPARADDSPYCRKVRARAVSDASLLIAPSLRLEGIKLPTAFQRGSNTIDPTGIGPEYQVRGGLTLSPIDIYKGFRVLGIGDADCEQHVTVVMAEEILAQDKNYGRAAALKKQIVFLEAQRERWEALLAQGEQRFASKVTTLQQTEELRTRVLAFERQRAQLAGDLARLESNGAKPFTGTLADLAHAIESTTMIYEKKVSHLRTLDTWSIHLTAGYIPPFFGADHPDAYGMVQLTHNLGAAWRNSAETKQLAAREDELKSSRYELTSRIGVFRATLRSSSTQATRELQIVESRVSALTAGRTALETSEALKAAHALALLDLELIAAEAERTYLTELIAQLRTLEES
jgi:hypothetical protein